MENSEELSSLIESFSQSHTDENSSIACNVHEQSDAYLSLYIEYYDKYNPKNLVEESAVNINKSRAVTELRRRNTINNSVVWPYVYSPYFTESEVNNLLEHWHRNGTERHYTNFERADPPSYASKIKELQERLKNTEDPEEIYRLKSEMIALGWNPEIEYTDDTAIKAKIRIESMYTRFLNNFKFLDCTGLIHTYKEINLNESEIDSYSLPVNIICFEDGETLMQFGDISVNEFNDLMRIAEVYTTYLSKDASLDPSKIKLENDNRVFPLPGNLTAAIIVEQIYEACNVNKYALYGMPVIKKIYEGYLGDMDVPSVNHFINSIGKSGNTPLKTHENGLPVFESYFSSNLTF